MRQRKLQSTVEFLMTYAWAITVIAVFVAFIVIVVGFKSPSSYTPSVCYITTTLPCQEALFASSSSASYFTMIFVNDFGTPIAFPSNALSLQVGFSGTAYGGDCYPANVPAGATVICNATLQGFAPSVGTQADTKFTVSYRICTAGSCPPAVYNTSGYSTGTVSPFRSVSSLVDLQTSTGTGAVVVDGIRYPSNTYLQFIDGQGYAIFAAPPANRIFSSWSSTGGVVVSNTVLQTTNATVSSPGNLIATFT